MSSTSDGSPDIALELARARARQVLFGDSASPGIRVGRYLIMERIGAGGMAEVYAAYDPQLERKVALKLIRASGDDEARSQRLVREAQALARLSHPNVVAVHDAGSFDASGSAAPMVFLAMELVHGVTLSRWLEARPRTWRQVLDVAIAAGHGLAAAHAAGLVHRDFKPDNVMIDSDPQGSQAFGRVRVVDFGLSRKDAEFPSDSVGRTDDEAIGNAIALTVTGSVVGTPAYMAIEQHEGRSADARTDQFSFCVTVWESLCGRRPFSGSSREAIAVDIAEGRITPPAPGRNVPSWVIRALTRGLSADADARWPDMASLLAALADDPARRRRRRLAAIAAVPTLALVPAIWFSHAHFERAECEQRSGAVDEVWNDSARTQVANGLEDSAAAYWAETWHRLEPRLDAYAEQWASARTRACAIDDVLAARSQVCFDERLDAFAALLRALDGADASTVARAIKAAQRLPAIEPCESATERPMRAEPDASLRDRIREARVELAHVRGLAGVGRYEDAARAAAALTTRSEAIGWEPLVAEVTYESGNMDERRGEHQAAVEAYERALELAWAVEDQELASVILPQLVFTTGASLGQHERALGLATVARIVATNVEPTPGLRTSNLHNALGNVARVRGERREALEHAQRCLDLRRAELPEEHPDVVDALNNLATARLESGEAEEATEVFEQALALREHVVGSDHPDVVRLLLNLAEGLHLIARYEQADAASERAIEIARRILGPRDSLVATALLQRAVFRVARGAVDDATVADTALALAIREATLGADHPLVADALQAKAHVHHSRGELAAAHEVFSRALDIQIRRLGDDHLEIATTKWHLGSIANNRGRHAEARAMLEPALAILRTKNPGDHEGIGGALDELGRAVLGLGEVEEAIALHLRAIAEFERGFDRMHPLVASALLHLARAQTAAGAPATALALLERARESIAAAYGPKHRDMATIELAAVDACSAAERQAEACEHARALVELQSALGDEAGLAEAQFVLATAQWACGGDRDEARALAERACAEPAGEVKTRLEGCASWLAAHSR